VRLGRRRPSVSKLARRRDAGRLVAALRYRDAIVDSRDRLFDLGAPVRRDAALALARMQGSDGVDVVAALLQALHDPFEEVRAAAASSLGDRADPRALPALVRAALSWREGEAAAAAALSAVRLAERAESLEPVMTVLLDLPRLPSCARGLVSQIADAAPGAAVHAGAQAAVRALGDQPLARPASGEVDGRGRSERAVRLLWWLGEASVEPLRAHLRTHAAGRAGAARALGAIGDRRAARELAACLQDPDAELRAAAASAIGRLADPSLAAELTPLTSDDDPSVRAAALGALRRLWQPTSAPAHPRVTHAVAELEQLRARWPSG